MMFPGLLRCLHKCWLLLLVGCSGVLQIFYVDSSGGDSAFCASVHFGDQQITRSWLGRWRLHQGRGLITMKRNQRSPVSERLAKKATTYGQSSSAASSAAAPPTFLEDLIEPLLAQLSISQINSLKRNSSLWASMLQTPSLRRACAAAHPKLFGLVRWNPEGEGIWTTVFDVKSFKWEFIELTEYPNEEEYEDAMVASDGGLVCFVPRIGKKLAALPIVVYNPLTNERKFIPGGEGSPFGKRQLILVQMVMDEGKCYRVVLVYGDKLGGACGAVVYNSRSGLWTKMNAGLVFGAGNSLWCGQQDPHVFDCTRKVSFNLNYIGSDLPGPPRYSFVKNTLFMLEDYSTPEEFNFLNMFGKPRFAV